MQNDSEIMAARLGALEVLLFALAQSLPGTALAGHFADQKKQVLASLRGSSVSARIVEHTEQTLARYEKRLGL